ncbi:hypothetical protein GL981_12930 (plasmid) [Spiroplasma citri]|nr:hypothetical protein GL981_12930 [Spiroplasma citri]
MEYLLASLQYIIIYIKINEDNNFVIRKSSKGDIGAGIVLNKIKGGQETGYKIWPIMIILNQFIVEI